MHDRLAQSVGGGRVELICVDHDSRCLAPRMAVAQREGKEKKEREGREEMFDAPNVPTGRAC